MNKLKVSVVIPLYNKEKYIERAIRSVCIQSINHIEILVVDDGSTDGGNKVVNNYVEQNSEDRIQVIHQKNAGVSAARNAGIERATAELVAFLDADDAWKPGFLETILRLRNKFPEAGLYATAFESNEDHGKIMKPKLIGLPHSHWEGLLFNYFKMSVLGDYPFCSSSVAIPKAIFKKIGGFLNGVTHGEDLEMWCRIAINYPIAYSNLIGATYYSDADQKADRTLIKNVSFFKSAQMTEVYNKIGSEQAFYLKEFIAKLNIAAAVSNYFDGDSYLARRLLADCDTVYFLPTKLWWSLWVRLPRELYWLGSKLKQSSLKSFLRAFSQRKYS